MKQTRPLLHKYTMDINKNSDGVMYSLTVFVDEDKNEYLWRHAANAASAEDLKACVKDFVPVTFDCNYALGIAPITGCKMYIIQRPRLFQKKGAIS
jgi:hypothetical protein